MSLQNAEAALNGRSVGAKEDTNNGSSKQDSTHLLHDSEDVDSKFGNTTTVEENSNLLNAEDLGSNYGLGNVHESNAAQGQGTATSRERGIGDVSKDNSSTESSSSTIAFEDGEQSVCDGNAVNGRLENIVSRKITEGNSENTSFDSARSKITGNAQISGEQMTSAVHQNMETFPFEKDVTKGSTQTAKYLSSADFGSECQKLRLCDSEDGSTNLYGSPVSDIQGDTTEHELVQADKGSSSYSDRKSGKDSAYSESPSSDLEFSASSSVASCAEDSGISSTVRDEELEEIPLVDNHTFTPEFFQEMSRLTADDMVASWVPKSLNTYAPNIAPRVSSSKASSSKDATDSSEVEAIKQSRIKGLFSRSGSESHNSAGWKLFGKVPPKEVTKPLGDHSETTFARDDVKHRSFGEPGTPTSKPKFLSLKRNSTAVPSSTTALIFENRPSNLPAKSPTEEKKHRQMYEAMVVQAKKKELRDKKKQEKELKQKSKQEKGIACAATVWSSEILPNWESMKSSRKARELWWQGLPPSVRGKIWKLAIGNDLQITYELFDIFQTHAYDKLIVTRNQRKKNRESGSVAELPTSDYPIPVVSSEHKVELIMLDVSRTFPSLCIFQEGGPFHDVLHSILGAYTCYRPDVGYVQGMSFIAAVLLLNMDPPDAFVSFANLLNKPCQLAFFRVDHPLMKAYFATFEILLQEFLPKISIHFKEENFSPDMYLIDWIFTLFSKSLPLDVACRAWDVFCRDGDDFLFRTALGILRLYQEDLMEMDFIHLGQFLTKLPDDISANNLFDAISSVNLTRQKFNQTLTQQKELATQIKTVTASAAK